MRCGLGCTPGRVLARRWTGSGLVGALWILALRRPGAGLEAPSRSSCSCLAGIGRSWTFLTGSGGCGGRMGCAIVEPRSSRACCYRSLVLGRRIGPACCCLVGLWLGLLALSAGCSTLCQWTGAGCGALDLPIRMNCLGWARPSGWMRWLVGSEKCWRARVLGESPAGRSLGSGTCARTWGSGWSGGGEDLGVAEDLKACAGDQGEDLPCVAAETPGLPGSFWSGWRGGRADPRCCAQRAGTEDQ